MSRPAGADSLTTPPRRTITKSDLLGHLVPMMSSYDWAHSGITHLFHNIQVRPGPALAAAPCCWTLKYAVVGITKLAVMLDFASQ